MRGAKESLASFLHNQESRYSWRIFVALTLLAYLFSVALRYLWIDWASQFPEFFWNGQLMINTNDGYYWAEGARDLLQGGHQIGDLSPVNAPISKLTAFLAKILPLSFETIILWMPALFGSLIVVPVMLIARALRQERAGLLAAMLAGIVWSYYNRTMAGYYDTDMLTIVFPTFVLWSIVLALLHKRNRYMALSASLMLLYQWWYPAAHSLDTAFALMLLIYTLILERKELYNYKLLLFLLLALMPLSVELKSLLIVALFPFFHFLKERSDRWILPLLGLGVLLFVILGGLSPIGSQIKGYLLHEGASSLGEEAKLHFFAVTKTVREAGGIPFELFAKRISGDPVIFLLSLVGYLMLALRYRVMWMALPMLGLGFLAMKGGLRFTVYAVPVMALGMGYLMLWFAQRLAGTFAPRERVARPLEWGLLLLMLGAILYPSIRHIQNYKVPTVFTKPEVEVLDRLKKIATREDYVLSWWDYGYPIRYYSDVKTLIDGGKHSGDVNYPVSFALTMPQRESASMARLDVEYTESDLRGHREGSAIEQILHDFNLSDPSMLPLMLKNPSLPLPPKSRDIYYYLPLRMLGIFPTVALFSSLDLKSGQSKPAPKLYQFQRFQAQGAKVFFGRDLYADLPKGLFHSGKSVMRLNSFLEIVTTKQGKSIVRRQGFDEKSPWYLLYLKSYGRFLLMDKQAFESSYVQLFLLDRYDPNLFEPVIMTPLAKVYRLKI